MSRRLDQMSTITPLCQIPKGTKVILTKLNMSDDMICQLCEIGLFENTPITMISNKKKCPLIIECRKSQIMLSRELSEQITVSLVEK